MFEIWEKHLSLSHKFILFEWMRYLCRYYFLSLKMKQFTQSDMHEVICKTALIYHCSSGKLWWDCLRGIALSDTFLWVLKLISDKNYFSRTYRIKIHAFWNAVYLFLTNHFNKYQRKNDHKLFYTIYFYSLIIGKVGQFKSLSLTDFFFIMFCIFKLNYKIISVIL